MKAKTNIPNKAGINTTLPNATAEQLLFISFLFPSFLASLFPLPYSHVRDMMFLSELLCVLKLIKNKDAVQKRDSNHYDIV